jgi:hypothetical protein
MSLQYLNECLALEKTPKESKFRHSSVHYVRALLEDHFNPRKFTLEEVEGLLQELFGWKDNK